MLAPDSLFDVDFTIEYINYIEKCDDNNVLSEVWHALNARRDNMR